MRSPDSNLRENAPADGGGSGGIMDEVRYIWRDLRLLIHDQLKIATLETKLVAESLVSMVATSVAVVLLLVTAWLGLISAAVVFMVELGLPVSGAILIAVAFNIVIALLLGMAIRRQVSHLQWPATLRTLRPSSADPSPQQSIHDRQLSADTTPTNVTHH